MSERDERVVPRAADRRGHTPSEDRIPLDRVEAVLIEHYPRLVRLAYLTLHGDRGRHRRVLDAHRIVQRALPRLTRTVRVDADGDVYTWLRTRIVRAALASGTLRGVPAVVGLRLFPRAGGLAELELDRALAAMTPPARAAYALLVLEGLSETKAARVTGDPEAVRCAHALREQLGADGERALASTEFDPCVVQTTPDDLLRRRRNHRLAAAAGTLAAIAGCVALTAQLMRPAATVPSAPAAGARAASAALDPRHLVRTDPETWADTSRVDLTAWPARGSLAGDDGLLSRALRVWDHPSPSVRRSVAPGATDEGPARSPQLLYAGELEGRRVVMFYDGRRTVRYTEPAQRGAGEVALDIARADDSGVTDASALTVVRGRSSARYLLAPWISESGLRDLRAPDRLPEPLGVAGGVTRSVPLPPAKGCGAWPALQLRSSTRIVENHRFLLTDLGGAAPAHLTYQPLPVSGRRTHAAARPVEATGPAALMAWSRTSCSLPGLDAGVRAVNTWDFAGQRLPGGGSGTWSCMRADTWQGQGQVVVGMRPDNGRRLLLAGAARDSAACSRFGQHVVASVMYRDKEGNRYLLAAGSRGVTRLTAAGKTASGTTLVVRDPTNTAVEARTRTGEALKPPGTR
ncbi:hypothetical protein EAO73_19195 [Streptomyces sp. col6]|uniref:hypothetical protein n=1 Tax=Streptomyces sp. col6 TaxID=2478958 RepID=UPI0011CD5D5E|nr:hypothetical protein [Streptomyces sp. col6]TXS02874.1 hypothetical protein EAO73_19195 [Streptomyces sp. col6]